MSSLHRLISLSLVLFVALASSAFAADHFPIHAWIGVPADQTTAERYKELAECGFTSSFSSFPNVKSTAAALDIAQAAGIKLFISLPELATDPEATAKQFMNHPALGGYHLQDEPSAADFPKLAQWLARIEGVDKSHPCYINLFPTYANAQQLGCPTYQEHIDRFVQQVSVPFISFDHYPIVGQQIRGDWYQNLEIIRNASLKTQKPFWAFCLSVGHGPYPVPTISHLRLQAFSDLAYGAQCIQYFTYWTLVDPTWNFHDGPIDAKGNRTATYAVVKQMNAEIQALAPVFLGCRVLAVAHTGRQPAGTTAYKPADPVKSLETDGSGGVVSLLTKADQCYLAIVNRDLAAPMTLKIRFDPAVPIRSVDKTGVSKPISNAAYSTRIDPGDICLFTWSARAANPPAQRAQQSGAGGADVAPLQTATTHPMKYYLSLPKGWSEKRTWPVLVAPSAHYGDKGATLAMFARERDARNAPFIIVQPLVINADKVAAMAEYRGAVADAISAADAATDGRDEAARGKFDAEGILAILQDVQKLYRGEEKVYITGFSSSTHVAHMFLFAHPELLKGVIINSGVYLGRGVDEEHLPLVNSPQRSGMEVKFIVGEEDRGYAFYTANWEQTKAKLLKYGHAASKLQMEVIKKGNAEKLNPGHSWYPARIMDFVMGVEASLRK